MKLKLLSLFASVILTLFVSAQNLSIADLIKLRTLESDDISIALMEKGGLIWEVKN